MSTFEATLQNLPKPILDKLRAIIGRVRRLLFIRGFFATLAVGLTCLFIIMGIDATMTLFSSAARWALSLSALAITAVTAWWFLVRPLSRKITLTHIARILEIRHPELQERISTAVELMSSADPESVKGSEELIAAVVDSAVVDVNRVDPKTEFKAGRASRFMLVGGAAAAAFLLLFALFPRHIGVLAARAFAPFLDIGNAWSDTIEVKPGDIRVAIGQSVTVEMTVQHDKLRRAEIRTKLPDGTESVERMTLLGETPDGAKRFSITFPSVAESFDYRIRAGSAVSEFYSVEAVPKPVVNQLTLRYDFPAYTKREPVEAVSDTGEIVALAHSTVSVTADLNKPVTQASLQIVGQLLESQPIIEGARVKWQFPLSPKTESRWRIGFTDADGFESDVVDRPITALPDKAPEVKIVAPTMRELRLRPTELLPIQYAVTEDIGLGAVDLIVLPEGEAVSREIGQPVAESDGQPGTWRGVASLNLASLELRPEQKRLTALVRVRDNLPAEYEGPNEGLSEKLTIIIDAGAKSLAEQTLAAKKEEIRKAIEEARQELTKAKSEAQQAERELARDEKVSTQAMRELDEFRERANEAQETLREVAQKTEDTLFQPQGEQLEKVADQQVAEAREAADMIPMTDQKDERIAEARTAQKQVDAAIEELKKVEKSLNDADDEMRMVAELNELANEQRQLAQQASQQARQQQETSQQLAQVPDEAMRQQAQQQLTEEQRRQMEQFRREQEQIQRELGERLTESPEALRDVLTKQQQQAQQLAEQAKAAAQRQAEMQKMTEAAAQSAEQPEQKEALQEQLVASLQQMQRQIAEETAALQDQLNQQQAEAGKPLDPAAEKTRQAAEALAENASPTSEKAAEAAAQASEALEQARQQAESMAAPSEQPAQPQAGEPQMAEAGKAEPQATPANQPQQPGQPQPAEAGKAATPQPAQPQAGEPQMAEAGKGEPQTTPANQPQQPGQPQPAEAGKAATPQPAQPQAGEPQMAEAGKGEPQATPANQPPTATPLAAEPARQQLAQLAEQQKMVAQQLQAIEAGQLDQALAAMEQQLAQESQDLQTQAEALESATEAAEQRNAARQAGQAESALQNAANQAQQAQQQLAQAQEARNVAQQQGQPTPPQAQQALSQSRNQQQGAERNLNQAAQNLEQTAQTLAQALQGMKPSPEAESDVLNPDNLSQAFNDTDQSAQSQDARQAAQNAQQAAESLQQLAQAAMDQLGARQPNGPQQQPNQPGQQQPNGPQPFADGADPQLNETGMKTADLNGDGIPPELQALGITAADWARLKGNLQSGGAAQGGDDLPAEYRDLVGRYFQVIAREAGKAQ
ncbi:MAG: hypothetical protein JNK37_16450 [Verrucomicrobiales bacterium]|nr:hypothetical protein [Verrucomicrobiales bacterium]